MSCDYSVHNKTHLAYSCLQRTRFVGTWIFTAFIGAVRRDVIDSSRLNQAGPNEQKQEDRAQAIKPHPHPHLELKAPIWFLFQKALVPKLVTREHQYIKYLNLFTKVNGMKKRCSSTASFCSNFSGLLRTLRLAKRTTEGMGKAHCHKVRTWQGEHQPTGPDSHCALYFFVLQALKQEFSYFSSKCWSPFQGAAIRR